MVYLSLQTIYMQAMNNSDVYKLLLDLMNISDWNLSSVSWHRSGRKTFPAMLDSLSTAWG